MANKLTGWIDHNLERKKLQQFYFFALILVVILIYYPSLTSWPWGDDATWVIRSAIPETRWDFHAVSYNFRPIQQVINNIDVILLGYESFLLTHIVSLLGLAFSVVLVALLGRKFHLNKEEIIVSTAFFALSSANTFSVIQMDTISQLLATIFILLLLFWQFNQTRYPTFLYSCILLILSLLAFLSKETAPGQVIISPFIVLLLISNGVKDYKKNLGRFLYSFILIMVALLVYLVIRKIAGGSFLGPEGTNYRIGFNPIQILKNIAMLLFPLIYIGSTLDIFPAINPLRLIFSSLLTIVFLFINGLGFVKTFLSELSFHVPIDTNLKKLLYNTNIWPVVGLALFVFSGMFPVVLIGKMSELYLFGLSPFHYLLFGILFYRGYLALRSRKINSLVTRISFFFLLVISLLWVAFGTHEKIMWAADISTRAREYYVISKAQFTNSPTKEINICWQSQSDRQSIPTYSIFVQSDWYLVEKMAGFAGFFEGINVKFLKDEVLPCDYYASLQAHKLKYENSHDLQ